MDIIAFGRDELATLPRGKAGQLVVCRECGSGHVLEASTRPDGTPSAQLLFYRCGERIYLAVLVDWLLKEMVLP